MCVISLAHFLDFEVLKSGGGGPFLFWFVSTIDRSDRFCFISAQPPGLLVYWVLSYPSLHQQLNRVPPITFLCITYSIVVWMAASPFFTSARTWEHYCLVNDENKDDFAVRGQWRSLLPLMWCWLHIQAKPSLPLCGMHGSRSCVGCIGAGPSCGEPMQLGPWYQCTDQVVEVANIVLVVAHALFTLAAELDMLPADYPKEAARRPVWSCPSVLPSWWWLPGSQPGRQWPTASQLNLSPSGRRC